MKKIFCLSLVLVSLFCINLYSQQFRTIKSEILVDGSGQVFMAPVWSPDGSKIAFTGESYKGISIIDLSTKNIKQLTDEDAAGFAFKWGKDSKTILTRVARYEGVRRYNAVKLFNVETGNSEALTDYRASMPGLPEFTPDEKVFLYSKDNLEIMDTAIKSSSVKKTGASEKIVYLRDDKIAVEDLSTRQLRLIEPVKGERVLNLQLSSDGSKAAFEIIGGDMYIINIDGTGLTNLGRGYRPKWSPDSEHLVYMITKDDGHSILSSDIFTIRTNGTEKINLTASNYKTEMNPSWSPDGKKIVFDVLEEGAIHIIHISK